MYRFNFFIVKIETYMSNKAISIDRDWTINYVEYEDAEVDHLVPFSKWWETVYENAQLVHWRCNQQKRNRVDES